MQYYWASLLCTDKKYCSWLYFTHCPVQNVKYSCALQYFCDVHLVSQCDTAAAILRIHRKAFNTFAIQSSLLCDSWMHMKHVLLDSSSLPHWNIFYQFREILLMLREVHLTSWQKYILLLDRNTFCWPHLLYFREELAAVPTFELQSVDQRLWRTNDISNPSVSYFPSSSFTLSPSIVCVFILSICLFVFNQEEIPPGQFIFIHPHSKKFCTEKIMQFF